MKKLFFSLIVILSFCKAFSQQVDSSQITQSITLTQDQHIYLIGFMGEIRSAEKIKYVNQVAGQYDATDSTKAITVTAPSSLIVRMYQTMTVLPEGVGYVYNNQIKDALMPQITNPWLGARIMEIIADNNRYLNDTKDAAKKLIESLQ
jgi:urease alpha subunit